MGMEGSSAQGRGVTRNRGLYFVGVLTYIVSLLPIVGVDPMRAVLLIPLGLATLAATECLRPRAASGRLGPKEGLIITLISVPYLALALLEPPFLLSVPAAFLLTTLLLYNANLQAWGNVTGTALIASLSFVWGGFIGPTFLVAYLYWTLYVFTGAVYVEYKLPFRRFSPNSVRLSWVVSLLTVAPLTVNHPLLALALVEPSFRFLRPGERLSSPKEIRNLGRKGLWKDLLFLTLLAATSVAYGLRVI